MRAAAIARRRAAGMLLACEVFESVPDGYSTYGRTPPKNCWYVLCGSAHPKQLGGCALLLCVSRKTGRVLLALDANGE